MKHRVSKTYKAPWLSDLETDWEKAQKRKEDSFRKNKAKRKAKKKPKY